MNIFGRSMKRPGGARSSAGSTGLLVTTTILLLAALLLASVAQAGKVAGFGVLGTGTSGAGTGQLGQGGVSTQGIAVNPTGAGGVTAGDVYVSDAVNNRASQFSREGVFVRSWGWDVVSSGEHNTGANEQQNVTVKATGGNFTLTITTASGSGSVTNGSNQVTNVVPSFGAFHIGDAITGAGIPATTTVIGVAGPILTISKNATSTNPAVTNLVAKETTANISATATAAQVQSALEAKEGVGAGSVTVAGGPGNASGATPYQVTFSAGPLSHNDIAAMTTANVGLTGGSPSSSAVVTTPVVGGGYEICQASSTPTDVCQLGVANSLAGGISGAQGLSVDPVTGNVFLVSNTSKRVNVYSATGQFYGAFGWGVSATTPEAKLQFCTTATGCLAGSTGAGAGQFGTMTGNGGQSASPSVSPLNGHLFVPQPGNSRIDEFSFTLAGNEVTGASYVKGFGGDVVPTIFEKQTVTLTGATGGTFALSFGGKSTDAAGAGNLEAGSNEVTNFKAADGAFVVGEEISGPGIPVGTRITAVTFDSLTLTNVASASVTSVTLGSALPFNASAAAVQGALRGLSSVGAGNVAVTGADGGPYAVEFTGSLAGIDVAQMTGDASKLTGVTPSVGIATTQTGANGAGAGFETCTVSTTCKAGSGNGRNGTFAASTPASLAVDSQGSIYATGQPSECSPCGVQKFNASATVAEEFAPAQLTPPEGSASPAFASKWVAVDPSNDHVLVVKRVTAQPTTFKIFEFTRTGGFIDSSPPGEEGLPAAQLSTNLFGPQGFAVGTADRAYFGIAEGPVKILGKPPAPKATIDPASAIGQNSATLNGVAQPSAPGLEGGFPTVAYFEYSSDGVSWSGTEPVAIGTGTGAGSANGCPAGNPPTCNVSKTVLGLTPGTTYLVRLVVSNGTMTTSSTANFSTTAAAPSISGTRAVPVTKTTATLMGSIDPNGKSTTYHFEWGADSPYANRIPQDFEAVAGSGNQPIKASANLAGLAPNTTYHFRIVATSASGTTEGPDVEFRTLNEAGLPANRGIELVSPADKRPAGSVETANPLASGQIFFQAAEDGETVGFPIFNGFGDSSAGGEVIYTGGRTDTGWQTTQTTPPALIPSPNPGLTGDRTGAMRYFSPADLGCVLIESHNPLTADTPPADVANGVYNLYRWDRDAQSYTLISDQVPLNPTVATVINLYYEVVGASADCSRVFFRTPEYNFIAGASRLYEWDNGVLRDAGLLPNGSVPVGGVSDKVAQQKYSVAPSGRLFFVAKSNEPADSGKAAVFVRKSASETVNASTPATATPTLGARYEAASRDGSHVYFLANYGLTSTSSSGPADNCSNVETIHNLACDLYDFNVGTGQLRNLSADSNAADTKGAVVQGVLDVSENGSSVYFAARGQLVPGEGRTYNQNLQGSQFANVYRWHTGQLSYIGSLTNRDMAGGTKGAGSASSALIHVPSGWSSQTTKSGEHLLFGSRDNMTGTNPDGAYQAYLYSTEDDATECISCPADGTMPHAEGPRVIQYTRTSAGFGNYTPRSLSEDGRAFFTTLDALTPDAVEGNDTSEAESENNIYEWNDGQVSLLASGPVRMIDIGGLNGRDVFITSYQHLDPRDFDVAADLYDFRAGGGFPAPPVPEEPCNPAEDKCQGTPALPPVKPEPSTSGLVDSGNPIPKKSKPKCPKGKVRKHGKCVKKSGKKKGKAKAQDKRAANNNRGGSK